jgi:hypothetical protein
MAARLTKRLLFVFATCTGLVVGGLVQQAGRMFLPGGAAKEFLTGGFAWQSPPTGILNLAFLHLCAGPFAMDVSLVGAAVGIATGWFFFRVLQ